MNLYTIPLSRTLKQLLLMLADGLMLVMALWLTFTLLSVDPVDPGDPVYLYFGLSTLVCVGVFHRIGLYRALLLYMGLQSGFIVLQGVSIATMLNGGVYYFLMTPATHDYAVLPIFWMISLLFIGGSRFVAKVALQTLIQNFRPKEPV
ncbi:MAG: hypothetical protein ACQETO_07360, partial [Pseudomonadota bacterium]